MSQRQKSASATTIEKKKISEKDLEAIEQFFFFKVHQRFNTHSLNALFTVDTFDTTGSDAHIVKCMPTSYPSAVNTIDMIYKVF